MAQKLFESFLDDPEQYRAAEQYWATLVADVANSMNQTNEWRQWIPREYADGTPMEPDGNPIFDGRSEKLNRAFRIMQHRPVGDDVEIVAWVKSYEPEYSDLPHDELVINLSLSQESANLARLLLQEWMRAETTPEYMTSFIRETLPPIDQRE
jgi:hypothetical protein